MYASDKRQWKNTGFFSQEIICDKILHSFHDTILRSRENPGTGTYRVFVKLHLVGARPDPLHFAGMLLYSCCRKTACSYLLQIDEMSWSLMACYTWSLLVLTMGYELGVWSTTKGCHRQYVHIYHVSVRTRTACYLSATRRFPPDICHLKSCSTWGNDPRIVVSDLCSS